MVTLIIGKTSANLPQAIMSTGNLLTQGYNKYFVLIFL